MSKYSPPPISARFPRAERKAVVAFVAQRGLTMSAYVKGLVRADMGAQSGVNTPVYTGVNIVTETARTMAQSTSVPILPTRTRPAQPTRPSARPSGAKFNDL